MVVAAMSATSLSVSRLISLRQRRPPHRATAGTPKRRFGNVTLPLVTSRPRAPGGAVAFAAAAADAGAGSNPSEDSYDAPRDSVDEHHHDDDDYTAPADSVDYEDDEEPLKKEFIDEQGNAQLESDLTNPSSFALMGDMFSSAFDKLSGGDGSGGGGSGGGEPFLKAPKRKREVGETALFVRKQDSSLFGIVEGLGLQYRMGIYKQVDDELLDEDPGLNQLLVSPGGRRYNLNPLDP
jgi:hypothetical protein